MRTKRFAVVAVMMIVLNAPAEESPEIRMETRTSFGGQVATGIELRGEVDGSAVTEWDTTVETDGWKPLTSGSSSTSQVCVLNAVAVEGGRLTNNTTWHDERVYLLRHRVIVPEGKTLTIDAGTIVKVTEGAGLAVESGGVFVCSGALFTASADDTLGGDTQRDGTNTFSGTDSSAWISGTAVVRVTFVSGGAQQYPERTYTTNQTYGTLPVPTRFGALFQGWFTNFYGAGTMVTATNAVPLGATALYAVWTTPSLSLSPLSTNVSAAGNSYTFDVMADTAWRVSHSEAPWLTLQTTEGTVNGHVAFTLAENTSLEARSATIVVQTTNGWVSCDFTVVQDGMTAVEAPTFKPVDGTTFTGSPQRVSVSCGTEDARIYYTLDAHDPDESSTLYAGRSFNISGTTMLKARAYKNGMLPSSVSTVRLIRLQTLPEALNVPSWIVTTSGDAPWRVTEETSHDGLFSARSGSITDQQSSTIQTAVVGSGCVSFWWKAYGEADPDGANWDHFAFLVDGVEKARIDGDQSDWSLVNVPITASGPHVLQWVYLKDEWDDEDFDGRDGGWVDQVAWQPMTFVQGNVPQTWLEAQGLLSGAGDPESAAAADVDGDGLTAAQEYLVGSDPHDASSTFLAKIAVSNGIPVISWTPDLLGERTYEVWGNETLNPVNWHSPKNGVDRFFKVKIQK